MLEKGDKVRVKDSDREFTIVREVLTLGDHGMRTGIFICEYEEDGKKFEQYVHEGLISKA